MPRVTGVSPVIWIWSMIYGGAHLDFDAAGGDRASTKRLLSAACAVICFLCAMTLGARAQIAPGDAFPSLKVAVPSGVEFPATKGHVVLVDFWASWCAPCKASFPALSRLHREFAARGLVIVGVSVDEKASAYETFVKRWAPPFPTLLDREQKLVQSVKVPAMPTSYLIGRDGRVRFVHQGFHGSSTENELRAHIASLLNEKAASIK